MSSYHITLVTDWLTDWLDWLHGKRKLRCVSEKNGRTHLPLCIYAILELSFSLDILTGLWVLYKLHNVKFAKESIMLKTSKSPSVKCVRVTSRRSGRVSALPFEMAKPI